MLDAVVIGGGPAGYAAAIRVAQLGGKAALVEKDKLGGACTNHGCIPTKTLASCVSTIDKLKKAKRFGINADVAVDFKAMARFKDVTVASVAKGVELLLESHDVELIQGTGRVTDKNTVKVDDKTIKTRHIVIATGSEPATVPGINVDGEQIINSDHALALSHVPSSMIIIGGGFIGVELGSIFSKLGCEVTIVEALPRILAQEEEAISSTLTRILERNNIRIITSAMVKGVNKAEFCEVYVVKDGKREKLSSEKLLVAVGRKPHIDASLASIGVGFDKKGVKVNSRLETSVKGIYAAGDVIGSPMLAHVAYEEAMVVADNVMGNKREISYDAVPTAIFTHPEIASVGIREGRVGLFPFSANGRAKTIAEAEGFIKAYVKSGTLVGVSMLGPNVTELLGEATLAVKNRLTTEQITSTIHAHPTLSEAFVEAVRAANNQAIHLSKSNK